MHGRRRPAQAPRLRQATLARKDSDTATVAAHTKVKQLGPGALLRS